MKPFRNLGPLVLLWGILGTSVLAVAPAAAQDLSVHPTILLPVLGSQDWFTPGAGVGARWDWHLGAGSWVPGVGLDVGTGILPVDTVENLLLTTAGVTAGLDWRAGPGAVAGVRAGAGVYGVGSAGLDQGTWGPRFEAGAYGALALGPGFDLTLAADLGVDAGFDRVVALWLGFTVGDPRP